MGTSKQRLTYDAHIRHAGYVTGVAYYGNEGQEFAIHISGQPDIVEASLRDIRINTLRFTEIDPPKPQDPEEILRHYEDFITTQRKKLTQLKRILKRYSSDPEVTAKKLHPWEQNYSAGLGCHSLLPDWERSRLIEFEILTPLNPRRYYQFSIQLDPTVAEGHCDIYKLEAEKPTKSVKVTVKTLGGNPDAYLYHNNSLIDSSTNSSGENETVEGTCENKGTWYLHVYGAGSGTARYDVRGNWTLSSDEQTGCPH